MHLSYRQIPAIRGQLGSLRHHVSEGICQTQGGAIGEDQDLEQIVTRLYLSLWNRNAYVSLSGQRLQGRVS